MIARTTLGKFFLSAALAATTGLAPGCIGASDDRLGSGNASKEGSGINDGTPIKTSTQQYREDKGDNPGGGIGTARPNAVDVTRTGGMGGTRGDIPPGPGDTGPRSSSTPDAGAK